MYKVAPLPGTFMLTAILGFFISVFYVLEYSETWGFTFALVFTLMFIASVISMTKADVDAELAMDEWVFHRKKNKNKK